MKRIGLAVLGLLVGFAVCEVALRLAARPDDPPVTPLAIEFGRWTDHPFLPFAGIPHADYTLEDGSGDELRLEHVRNNAYGFRAHEFPDHKGPDDFFIVCLGGSTTYGRRVESNELTWPELLERRLAERYPQRRIRAFNLGLDRATSVVSVVNMALVAAHLEPDLVIVYHGYNDLAALGARDYRTDHAHFYADFDPQRVSRGLQRTVPRWLLRSYVVARVTYELDRWWGVNDLAAEIGKPHERADDRFAGFDGFLGNFRTIESIADGIGAHALFSTFQFRDGDEPTYAEFNDRLRAFFDANGLDYVDQARLLPDGDPSVNTDVCHFTQKGREMMAENFYRHIVERGLVR